MSLLSTLLADLTAESADLDHVVADLPAARWGSPTPADGWTIAHQIAHLAWTDDQAVLAATDPAEFQRGLGQAAADPDGFVEAGAEEGASAAPAELLARWRRGRSALAGALTALPDGAKVPWYGPPMAAPSLATARLMETWAHGLDVRDALGVPVEVTSRLRNVAHLGVRTRGFSFAVNGLPAPEAEVAVELDGPDGERWSWGDPAAANRISGPALDFCLLITQRRHRDDLALTVHGPVAEQWAAIAQAFAGPPGPGRPRLSGQG